MRLKTFGELKIGDTVYFVRRDIINTMNPIKEIIVESIERLYGTVSIPWGPKVFTVKGNMVTANVANGMLCLCPEIAIDLTRMCIMKEGTEYIEKLLGPLYVFTRHIESYPDVYSPDQQYRIKKLQKEIYALRSELSWKLSEDFPQYQD